MSEDIWYQSLRLKWKPEKVRLLLIGESAPDDDGDPTKRRFFYSENLSGSDFLFRGVTHALYAGGKLTIGEPKAPWLERLMDDGVYLIDLASAPINRLKDDRRRKALQESVPDCVQRVIDLTPQGIAICHTEAYKVLHRPLREASLPLLHEIPLPFPTGNWQAKFVTGLREAVARMPQLAGDAPQENAAGPDHPILDR